MRLGFQFQTFDQPPAQLGAWLAETAQAVEAAGFDSIWTMDHLYQLPMLGPIDAPMVEAYSTLSFLAAHTKRVTLGALVTGPMLRHPGMLIKQITAIDVLSGGRAMLGIGASWFEEEHVGFGVPFPSLAERFERLEETLAIAHHMWEGKPGPFEGKHYRLANPVNSPNSIRKPHPRILVGGGGEQKTLRLVAHYADACNIYMDGVEDVQHKLEVLRERCEEIGRPYDEIERTSIVPLIDLGPKGEKAGAFLELLGDLAGAGIQAVYGTLVGEDVRVAIEIAARDVIPQAAAM
jgi:F420-dependent oxidoreductase-like protein